MTNISKLLNIVLYLLLAVTLVFAGMFYFGGLVPDQTYDTPVYTEAFLNWGKVLVVITAGIAIIFEVFHLVLNPKNAIRSLISVVLLLLVVLVSYGLADATPLKLTGYTGPDNVASMLIMSDTMLFGTYILFGVAIAAILYTELSRVFK